MTPIQTVDDYIAHAPEDLQPRLNDLRAAIRAAAPNANERISYNMPYYEYKGRFLYFQLWKKHIGLYALSSAVLDAYAADLQPYAMPKTTLRFPLDEDLPIPLIKRLVQAQVREKDKGGK